MDNKCNGCNGKGWVELTTSKSATTCPVCNGSGMLKKGKAYEEEFHKSVRFCQSLGIEFVPIWMFGGEI